MRAMNSRAIKPSRHAPIGSKARKLYNTIQAELQKSKRTEMREANVNNVLFSKMTRAKKRSQRLHPQVTRLKRITQSNKKRNLKADVQTDKEESRAYKVKALQLEVTGLETNTQKLKELAHRNKAQTECYEKQISSLKAEVQRINEKNK